MCDRSKLRIRIPTEDEIKRYWLYRNKLEKIEYSYAMNNPTIYDKYSVYERGSLDKINK